MTEKANFKVYPRLAKLLGESYRSTEYALKELVDNAWDADATVISITLPDPVTLDPIIVQDNGSGMTEQEMRNEYLTVANDRRSRKGNRTTRLKRLVKGRKGIGKFAGLMIASIMEVQTVARRKKTQVVISKESLLTEEIDLERINLPLTVSEIPDDISGTTVTLTDLNQRYEFPLPEKLKSLLMLEYGREQDVVITAPHYPHLFTACKSMGCLPHQSSDSRRWPTGASRKSSTWIGATGLASIGKGLVGNGVGDYC